MENSAVRNFEDGSGYVVLYNRAEKFLSRDKKHIISQVMVIDKGTEINPKFRYCGSVFCWPNRNGNVKAYEEREFSHLNPYAE